MAIADWDGELGQLVPEQMNIYGLGLVGGKSIKDFIVASGGVDTTEDAFVKMNHNMDFVTLRNPFKDSTADFHVSEIWTKKKSDLLGRPGKIIEQGQDDSDFTLAYNESKTIKNEEGKVKSKGKLVGRHINQDISVTFTRFTQKQTVTDTATGKPKEITVVEEGATGGGLPALDTSTSETLKYVAVGIGLLALLGGAYWYLTKQAPKV